MPIMAEQIIANKRSGKQKTEHGTIAQPINRFVGGIATTIGNKRTGKRSVGKHNAKNIIQESILQKTMSLAKRLIEQLKGGFLE